MRFSGKICQNIIASVIILFIFKIAQLFITARKRSLRRLCFYRHLSVHRGGMCGCSRGACVVAPGGGHAWLLWGGHVCLLWGGMCACSGGCAWLLQGGRCGCSVGACMVGPRGGMHGCSGGCAWLLQGGHAWLLPGGVHGCSGGMHGCSWGCMWLLPGGHVWLLGGVCGFFDEIRSMSGRYTSYWNAFLLKRRFLIQLECIPVGCVLAAH